jgi:hypothetical protein
LEALLWMKQILATAARIFGSISSTELAEIIILSLLGMIVSALVLTPGDQTLTAVLELCNRIAECY